MQIKNMCFKCNKEITTPICCDECNKIKKKDVEFPYVKIKMTEQYLVELFKPGEKHFELVCDGLHPRHNFKTLVQDPTDGYYYLFFATDDCPEGCCVKELYPVFRRLDTTTKLNEDFK